MTEFESQAINALADLKVKQLDSFHNRLIWNLYETLIETPDYVWPPDHSKVICNLVLTHLHHKPFLCEVAKTELTRIESQTK